MSPLMRKLDFKLMALAFQVRDFFRPPARKLKEAGLRPGFRVLDFGCGPGSYSLSAAEMVGEEGKVYSQDILPHAIEYVRKAAREKGLANLEFICSSLDTGLESGTMDVVLLYDTFHHLKGAESALQELYRVLKTEGVLSFSDHHLEEEAIVAGVTKSRSFSLSKKGEATYSFMKTPPLIVNQPGEESRLLINRKAL